MRRAHAVAAVIEDATSQNGWRTFEPDLSRDGIGDELGLHGLEKLQVEDPELGCVSLEELRCLRGKLGLPVERDFSFTADHPMSVYAEAARQAEGITEDTSSLLQAAAALAARRRS